MRFNDIRGICNRSNFHAIASAPAECILITCTRSDTNRTPAIDLIVNVSCHGASEPNLTKSIPFDLLGIAFSKKRETFTSRNCSIFSLLFFNFSYVAPRTVTPQLRRVDPSPKFSDSANLRAGRVQCRCNYGRVEGDVRRYE